MNRRYDPSFYEGNPAFSTITGRRKIAGSVLFRRGKLFPATLITTALLCFALVLGCSQGVDIEQMREIDTPQPPDPNSITLIEEEPTIISWDWQNPYPQDNRIEDVDSIGERIVWAVGYFGTIIKSTDAGITWSVQESGIRERLYNIEVVDESTAWVDGECGVLLRTVDGGSTWISVPKSPTSYPIEYVSPIDTEVAWLVENGRLFKTIDGGITWHYKIPKRGAKILSAFPVSVDICWVKGKDGSLYLTDDGGSSWAEITAPVNMSGQANGFYLKVWSRNSLWLIYENRLYTTEDAGRTWVISNNSAHGSIAQGCIVDKKTIWAIDRDDNIHRTADGGRSWSSMKSEKITTYHTLPMTYKPRIYAASDELAWSVGGDGKLYRTTDGGKGWAPCYSGVYEYLVEIDSFDGNTSWVVGANGTIMITTDGGDTWALQDSGTGETLNGISVCDEHTAWVAGDNGCILKTTDGGTSWIAQDAGTDESMANISCANPDVAWAVTREGTVLNTADGGETWTSQFSGENISLYGISAVDEHTAWATGSVDERYTASGGTKSRFMGMNTGWG